MSRRRKPASKDRPEETGALVKHGKGFTRVALVYPNTYQTGMSSLGFQTVYRLANQEARVACERVFLPDPVTPQAPVKSVESGLPLNQFDIILFSISFENDFIHLIRLLSETGIPLRSPDRNHIHHPMVVAGGVACFLNPEPIAPFVDLFLLGEAECLLPDFFKLYHRHPDRLIFLETLEKELPGSYIPGRHTPVLYESGPASADIRTIEVRYLESLEQTLTHTSVLTSGTAFKDIFLVETLKGCPHGCRFCTAGFIYRPPRLYPYESICRAMDAAKGQTDRIGLVSSAVLDHPDFDAVCQYGIENGFTLSFSSLRADKLNDRIIETLSRTGVKTATIAPEAGSERMRRIINKKLTQDQILEAAEKLVENRIPNLRLYFMIGLPFETDEDVIAIVRLTTKIKQVFLEASRKNKKIGTITLSVNPFIPKPCTPFQWAAMADEKVLKQRLHIIRQGLKKTANVVIQTESLKKSKINALLSLGDRHAADLLESAAKEGWPKVLRENESYVRQVVYSDKPLQHPLPWSILHHRVRDDFLVREWQRAGQKKESAACPMKACQTCRICIQE